MRGTKERESEHGRSPITHYLTYGMAVDTFAFTCTYYVHISQKAVKSHQPCSSFVTKAASVISSFRVEVMQLASHNESIDGVSNPQALGVLRQIDK